MNSVHISSAVFPAVDPDLRRWLRGGAGIALIAACLMAMGALLEESPLPVPAVRAPATAVAADYVALRDRVEATLPAVRVTSDAPELVARGAAVQSAVRAARPHASRGEIFTPAMTAMVRSGLAADVARRSAGDRRSVMRGVPATAPRINEPYPGDVLATFPALLLQALPRLPADLEYRFLGRDLIIRDARTNLIVDYLPEATLMAGSVTP